MLTNGDSRIMRVYYDRSRTEDHGVTVISENCSQVLIKFTNNLKSIQNLRGGWRIRGTLADGFLIDHERGKLEKEKEDVEVVRSGGIVRK